MSAAREMVDGVAYVEAACVGCRRPMSVAESALEVADRDGWPRCTDCLARLTLDDITTALRVSARRLERIALGLEREGGEDARVELLRLRAEVLRGYAAGVELMGGDQ